MAPALTLAPRETPASEPVTPDADKHRRQILAPVNNLAPHMENDAMGVQDQPSNVKDTPGLDMILGDFSNNELLQVIKTLENSAESLSPCNESIFPLDEAEAAEPPSVCIEKIKSSQERLERKCAFLMRRLRILQARSIGKRISEEVSQAFDKCTRGARKDGGGRPMGLKALLKRVETTAALQASAASRSVIGPKYYNAGSSRGDASRSSTIGISSGTLTGLEDTAGALRSHLSVVKHELDSDATASSSGAESNDEAVTYNNLHQTPMPLEKRALWTWQRERASIATRWGWLHAQVQELEYKIRQHSDLRQQVREAKGPVEFEGEPPADAPGGYAGALPGSGSDDGAETCARVRPLRRETFKKRKLLQLHNLHIATSKAAKPTDIRCSCEYPIESCPVCTGRADPTLPAAPHSTLAPQERIALVDPCYHPVLSDIKDVSPAMHMSALCSRGWFRPRGRPRPAPRAPPRPAPRIPPAIHHAPPAKPLKPKLKGKRGRPPLSRKIREREREEDSSASALESYSHALSPDAHARYASASAKIGLPSTRVKCSPPKQTRTEDFWRSQRGRGRASTESRQWRRQSYDIDNIVIPQSVAAATRPQILTYKQIITPKWRVNVIPDLPMNNGNYKSNRMSVDESDDEDLSDSVIAARHSRAECRERSRYVRKRRARRSIIETDVPVPAPVVELPPPPPPELPPPPPPPPDLPTQPQETVKPYSPRQFPLPDDAYVEMLSAMPQGYRPSSPEPTPPPEESTDPIDDDSSTLSPTSMSVYGGDDPDDIEWDPSVEKSEVRRKSTFR